MTDVPLDNQGRKGRFWLWFLGIGGAVPVVLLIVIVGMNAYRARQPLTRARLDAAWTRWKAADVRDYDMAVRVSGSTQARYEVQVRDNKVVAATQNGKPFEQLHKAYPWTVPGLFSVVLEQDVENDAKKDAPGAHTQAVFDPDDGHLIRYLRGTGTHTLLLEVELHRLN